jgi:hypothetical protein
MHLNFTMIFGYNWRHLVFPRDSPSPSFSVYYCRIFVFVCISLLENLHLYLSFCMFVSIFLSTCIFSSVFLSRLCLTFSICLFLYVSPSLSVFIFLIFMYLSHSFLTLISVSNSVEHLYAYISWFPVTQEWCMSWTR